MKTGLRKLCDIPADEKTRQPLEVLRQARIGYVGDPRSLAVNEIEAWDRKDAPEMISGGSGPKDYTGNKVRMLFDARPEVDRVVLVRGNGPMFFLVRQEGCYFDCLGKQVVARATSDPQAVQARGALAAGNLKAVAEALATDRAKGRGA